MGLFSGHYIKALAVTAITMAAYCLTVVPFIEPTEQAEYSIPKSEGPQATNHWWQTLFNQGDWQLHQPTVVHNSRGVLLAQTWEQIRPESWKLSPLTMILLKDPIESVSDDPPKAQDVWIITAQEAIIHFEQPFDLRSGIMPSVQKGQLSGDILISQMNSGDPSKQEWQLRTKDVNIDRRRIWTQQEVQIDFDSSRIRGYDLRINLLSDILSKRNNLAEDNSTSKYGPLDEIELMHLTELAIALKPGGIWANANPDLLQIDQPVNNLPARVEANCGGRFTFNFSKESASLTGGVHLKHYLGGLPPDEFLCHKVNLRLQSDSQKDTGRKVSGLALKEIEADGIDSLEEFVGEKWVELRSPLLGASARAKKMRFDFAQQRVELAGKLDQPGATHSVAELNYRGYHFRAPSLQYQASPEGPDGQALHAGWMAAQGAGELSSPSDSRLGESQVRWQESFTWAPTEIPGEQKIVLSGQTLVEQKQQGYLTADVLHIWLSKTPSVLGSPRTQNLQPKRILSRGKSVIATNRAQVSVESLDVEFVFPATTNTEGQDGQRLWLGDSSLSQFVSQPSNDPNANNNSKANNNPSNSTIAINGQTLVAKIASAGKQLWIEAMTIHGPLDLKSAANGKATPWHVEGAALNMASTPRGDLDIEIEGQPASIHVAEGSIQGPRIGFNQQQNRVWMDQPGEFTLPSEIKTASGQTMNWVIPLQCKWKKRMVFDGDRIRFEGDIELLGTLQQNERLWYVKGNCQELDLQLSQPIKFEELTKLKQLNEPSQLRQVVLRQNVDLLVSQGDIQGNRISRSRLVVPTTLTINVPEEKIVAAGPGRAYTNFVSQKAAAQLSSSSNFNAPSGSNNLSAVSMTYRDNLTVFMDRTEVVVDGDVKVLASPIRNWDEELGPDDSRLARGQLSMSSDQIKVYDTADLRSTQATLASQGLALKSSQWEIQASGRVRFDGNTDSGEYTGSASQIVYLQSKDQLRVAGDGRTKAVIRELANPYATKPEPTTTSKISSGLFSVKERKLLQSEGLEFHYENPEPSGQPSQAQPLYPNVPGSALPAIKPVQPNGQDDKRGINRFLQGFGSQ